MNNKGDLEHLLDSLEELATEARDRAEEFEEARNIASDFVAKLKSAGVYRILVAREQGGLGGGLRDWLRMATTLAEADASTGWTCGHGAACSALIANIADPVFVKSFFSIPTNSAAWSNLPRVEVTEEPGGLRINGSWAFGTGCSSADYVGGKFNHPTDMKNNKPRSIVALAPIEEVRINETWNPIGLAGTGSHEIVFEDVFVPSERIFDWPIRNITTDLPTSVYASGAWFISMCAAATHLGLARRALDEARIELTGKNDIASGKPLLERQGILESLEEAEGLLNACRAGLEQAFDQIEGCVERHTEIDEQLRMRVRLACVTAVHQGEAIVRTAYGLVGARAISRAGVMQRLYRDASCLMHHVSANRKSFETVGRFRLGLDPLTFAI